MKKALFYGILASFFFAFTFLLNRSMHLAGGYWLWSACLRYLFTFPILAAVLAISGKKQKTRPLSHTYPLGNRKVMSLVSSDISTLERVYAMTLCSLPVWIFLSIWAFITHGLPGRDQLIQSFFVALFSGTAATVLFFKATDMVKHNHKWLAVIEATQSGEVIFTLLGGILFLKDPVPSAIGLAGIAIIVAGMTGNSLCQ